MSRKPPVMSHDPLADLEGSASPVDGQEPEVAQEPGEAPVQPDVATVDGGGDEPLCLPSSLTVADVGEWHAQVVAQLQSAGALTIDGTDVEMIDGAGLQLLAALFKEASTGRCTIAWKDASEVLVNGAGQLGLSAVLKLDQRTAA